MQINAIINATDQTGKKINTTISYMRQSQKSKATQLATALNALTTNIYKGVQVNEIDIDPTSSQNLPQQISVTYQAASGTYLYTVHRLGTGNITVYYGTQKMTVDQSTGTFSYNSEGPFTVLIDSDNTYSQGFLIYTRS